MTLLTKTLFASAVLATLATPAFSQIATELNSGMAIVFSGGKMMQMSMPSGAKNHAAMMRHARKLPNNTVVFMDGGQMLYVPGRIDPTGNFFVN